MPLKTLCARDLSAPRHADGGGGAWMVLAKAWPLGCEYPTFTFLEHTCLRVEMVAGDSMEMLGARMTQLVRTEKYQRGFFGHAFKWLFIAFNAVMLIWLIGGMMAVSNHSATLTNEAERAGAAIGTAIGVGAILFIWIVGAVILGLFTMLTKGKKIIVEETRL